MKKILYYLQEAFEWYRDRPLWQKVAIAVAVLYVLSRLFGAHGAKPGFPVVPEVPGGN